MNIHNHKCLHAQALIDCILTHAQKRYLVANRHVHMSTIRCHIAYPFRLANSPEKFCQITIKPNIAKNEDIIFNIHNQTLHLRTLYDSLRQYSDSRFSRNQADLQRNSVQKTLLSTPT